MIINVDYREKTLLKKLQELKVKNKFGKIEIQTSNLPLGDVVILNKENKEELIIERKSISCLLYTSPSPRDVEESRMPSSA